jgi:hypothetical protein
MSSLIDHSVAFNRAVPSGAFVPATPALPSLADFAG